MGRSALNLEVHKPASSRRLVFKTKLVVIRDLRQAAHDGHWDAPPGRDLNASTLNCTTHN